MTVVYRVVALAVVLACSVAQPAGAQQLRPVDESSRDASFVDFRQSLIQIVERRDTMALLRLLDPGIKNDFGGDGGANAFKTTWRPDAADSDLWKELGEILRLGGAFRGADSFEAPYVFARWPDQYEPFSHVAIIGQGVRARAAPRVTARVLTRLSYDIVRLPRGVTRDKSGWTFVILRDGRRAYIASAFARSPVDYRVIFTRVSGAWRLTALVAGD